MNSQELGSLILTFHNVLRCNSEFGGRDIQSQAARLTATAEFQRIIEPMVLATRNQETSRKIALEELRAAIIDAFEHVWGAREKNASFEQCRDAAWDLVYPWLTRLAK